MKTMDNKKILLLSGGVAAGAVLIYFLTRSRASAPAAGNDGTPAPPQPETPNPWQVLGTEFLSLWQNRRGAKTSTQSNYTQTEGAAVDQPSYLKRGSQGAKVRALQRWLNESSGTGLAIDGDFGPATEAAVKAEQDPFNQYVFMYPNSLYGQVSKTFYDLFIKSYE